MDPEPTNGPRSEPLDDATLAAMVREVADGWHMPPQRLDEVTWRDRVGAARTTRGARASAERVGMHWSRRLVGATTLALVATVVLSLAAVWLTAPRANPGIVGGSATPGNSGNVNGSASATPSGTPDATALPTLGVYGDQPSVTRVLTTDGIAYHLADLTSGTLSGSLFYGHDAERVVARPGGGWVCFCATLTTRSVADPATLAISLIAVDTAGVAGTPVANRTLTGYYDPRATNVEQGAVTTMDAVASPDGQLAFLEWSYRTTTGTWSTGVDVIDLATLAKVDSVTLPASTPAAAAGAVWTRTTPAVSVSPVGDQLFVSSYWWVDTSDVTVPSGTDHWVVPWTGGRAGTPVSAGAAASACSESGAGYIDATTVYAICWGYSVPVIERRDLSGSVIGSVEGPRPTGGESGGTLSSASTGAIFLWEPVSRRLSRYDLVAGTVSTATAPLPTGLVDDGPLAALGRGIGRFIAPTVAAKFFLDPGIVVSPDGTRVYALGIGGASETRGSLGVYVFDATTLAVIDQWAPTADLSSIAISDDGRSVYAAGSAGSAINGTTSFDDASITVYDAATGDVRLIAGALGPSTFQFADDTLR